MEELPFDFLSSSQIRYLGALGSMTNVDPTRNKVRILGIHYLYKKEKWKQVLLKKPQVKEVSKNFQFGALITFYLVWYFFYLDI